MILWTNGTFYTMEDDKTHYNQILTNKGRVIALGDDSLNFKYDKIIDLKGTFVYPGFTDGHMHLIGYGRKLNSINLNRNNNKADVLNIINNYFNNKTLKIEGYVDLNITKDELDKISNKEYIILRHNDYHSFTVNSKVLTDLNIISNNGIIKDEVIAKKIVSLWEDSSKDVLKEYLIDAIKELYKNGITNVHTDDLSYFNSYNETLEIMLEVLDEYPFRINTLIHYDVYDQYLKGYPLNKYLKDIQVKLFYDGTISSKTAYLSENYKEDNHKGSRIINNLDEILKKIQSYNNSAAIHVIGDEALKEVVNILNNNLNDTMPHRIVHASLSSLETIENIKNHSIDIQPLFIESDKDVISKNIDHDVLIYPFKKYIDENILVNSSSDAPVESVNIFDNIRELMKLGISNYNIVKTYTVNPSLTINDNGGYIKVGRNADFTAFDKDLFTISIDTIKDVNITYTIVDENVVYHKKRKS